MSIVEGIMTITCDKCGHVNDILAENADFENTGVVERQMGAENSYLWEDNFKCENCDNEIRVKYEVWEYPLGAFNNDSIEVDGGKYDQIFDYDFIGESEDE